MFVPCCREFVVMCAICDTLLPSFNREDLEGAVNKFVRYGHLTRAFEPVFCHACPASTGA